MTLLAKFLTQDIFTIDGVFSVEECTSFIARAEAIGFQAASVRTESGGRMMPTIRNNDRVNLVDRSLADDMWNRVAPLIPPYDAKDATGVDERLRFYRYAPGQEFKRHKDGSVANDAGDTSKLSYLIYLNDNFEGGATTFRSYTGAGANREKIEHVVKPKTGAALLFRHERWHAGASVLSGKKYVLRTDVFYGS